MGLAMERSGERKAVRGNGIGEGECCEPRLAGTGNPHARLARDCGAPPAIRERSATKTFTFSYPTTWLGHTTALPPTVVKIAAQQITATEQPLHGSCHQGPFTKRHWASWAR